MNVLPIMVAVAAAAYLIGRHQVAPTPTLRSGKLSDLERRLAQLERLTEQAATDPAVGQPGAYRLDKPFTVSHYEALADEVARERRIAGGCSVADPPAYVRRGGPHLRVVPVTSGGGHLAADDGCA